MATEGPSKTSSQALDEENTGPERSDKNVQDKGTKLCETGGDPAKINTSLEDVAGPSSTDVYPSTIGTSLEDVAGSSSSDESFSSDKEWKEFNARFEELEELEAKEKEMRKGMSKAKGPSRILADLSSQIPRFPRFPRFPDMTKLFKCTYLSESELIKTELTVTKIRDEISHSSPVKAGPSKTVRMKFTSGLYFLEDLDMMVSIPERITSSTSEIFIKREEMTCYRVLNEGIVSDKITLLPHGALFSERILIRFPVKSDDINDVRKVNLLLSDADICNENHWINVEQHNTMSKHRDEMFWFIDKGYCYLFTKHFSHIFLAENVNIKKQEAMFLNVSLHAMLQRNEDESILQFTIGFHCDQCCPDILSKRNNFGILLQSRKSCFYSKEGNLTVRVHLNDNKWKVLNNSKEINCTDLMHLCHMKNIYDEKITFVLEHGDITDEWMKRLLSGYASVVQGELPPVSIDILIKPKQLMNEEKAHSDIATITKKELFQSGECLTATQLQSPAEATLQTGATNNIMYSLQQFINQIFVAPGFPNTMSHMLEQPFKDRHADCVFSFAVLNEQDILCKILDNDYKEMLSHLAKEIGDTNGTVDKTNITALALLQVWKIHVVAKECTWEELYHILVKLNCDKAADQLQVTFEKHQLLEHLDVLKHNLKFKNIIGKLVSSGIIDIPERNRLRSMEESEAVEEFILKILMKCPYSCIKSFQEILNGERHFKDNLPNLLLCKENKSN